MINFAFRFDFEKDLHLDKTFQTQRKYEKLLIVIISCFVIVSIRSQDVDHAEQQGRYFANLQIFNAIYKELQTFYVDSIDAEKSINTAIGAMLNDIDPYTEYIPAKEQEQFRTMTTGEYAGIGSMIQQTPEGSSSRSLTRGVPPIRPDCARAT